MKDRIIYIETSTSLTSVALSEQGRIVAYRQTDVPRSQASLTAPFIDALLRERGLTVKDCDAVCVSKGPGSYTGLRVGSSTAKGLCFGADLPLIAVGTLDTLVAQAQDDGLVPEGCKYIIPMIDARRMEVYSAVFSAAGERLTEISPVIVDGTTYAARLAEGTVLFIGDGALKCRDIIYGTAEAGDCEYGKAGNGTTEAGSAQAGDGLRGAFPEGSSPGSSMPAPASQPTAGVEAYFAGCCPRADAMLRPAMQALKAKRFEDTAYFEPFYLKQFVATVSAKKLF
ncbi:MAG: tRNA (adenosine(37)-N6)-threonylcarbamoyltransferase complex dimerization subunit type 1 TsaB [Bacteroidales bacterium]|nr:tRNA (adenosine(37)-N6)-threonylcarbamoyltransferase complex dimerization subunit type 1 TsaB [Bacteroidales bacterium]